MYTLFYKGKLNREQSIQILNDHKEDSTERLDWISHPLTTLFNNTSV